MVATAFSLVDCREIEHVHKRLVRSFDHKQEHIVFGGEMAEGRRERLDLRGDLSPSY